MLKISAFYHEKQKVLFKKKRVNWLQYQNNQLCLLTQFSATVLNQMFKSLTDSTISPRLWSCSKLQNSEKRICCVEQHSFHLFFADFPNICQDIFTWTVLFYCQRFYANHTHLVKVSQWWFLSMYFLAVWFMGSVNQFWIHNFTIFETFFAILVKS